VLDDELTIACGTGAVRLVEVQRAGSRAVSAGEFVRGSRLAAGAKLS
jgi:methionyl-tRNA formyltransferase